jgi:hypothetical protein
MASYFQHKENWQKVSARDLQMEQYVTNMKEKGNTT